MRRKTEVSELIKGTDHERLDLLPADFSYRHMDLALDSFKRPTRRLASVLAPIRDDYDYVFLDCPPSISLVSESVFEAADALLVPIIPATLSARTFEQLLTRVDGHSVFGFFSMVDIRKRLHRDLIARFRLAASDGHARGGDPHVRGGRTDGRGAHGGRRDRARLVRRRWRTRRCGSTSAAGWRAHRRLSIRFADRSALRRSRQHQPTASYEAVPEDVHRVLLLYSGGLDTSVMLKWIQDQYEAEVVALTVNLGQPGEDYEV